MPKNYLPDSIPLQYFAVYSSLKSGTKFPDLVKELGEHDALYAVITLFYFTAVNRSDSADLSSYQVDSIANWCKWNSDPQKTINALIKSGFLSTEMIVIGWKKYQPALKKREENKEFYDNLKTKNTFKNLLSADKNLKVLISPDKELVKHKRKGKERKGEEIIPSIPLKGDENVFSISDWNGLWEEFRAVALDYEIMINWTPDTFEKKDLVAIANDCGNWEKYVELIDRYISNCIEKNINPSFKGYNSIKLLAQDFLTEKITPNKIIQTKIRKLRLENGEYLECEEEYLIKALGKWKYTQSKDTFLLFISGQDYKSKLELFQEAIRLKNNHQEIVNE